MLGSYLFRSRSGGASKAPAARGVGRPAAPLLLEPGMPCDAYSLAGLPLCRNLHVARKHEPRLKSPHSGGPSLMSMPPLDREMGWSHDLSVIAPTGRFGTREAALLPGLGPLARAASVLALPRARGRTFVIWQMSVLLYASPSFLPSVLVPKRKDSHSLLRKLGVDHAHSPHITNSTPLVSCIATH